MKKPIELYEQFHRDNKLQKRIIKEKDFTYGETVELINKCLAEFPTNKVEVYDVGCGTGTLSFYLASKGYSVYGSDISKNSVDTCKRNSKNLNLESKIIFDLKEFPNQLPDKTFDFILCSEILEHISDDNKGIKSIYKLLNKNGILLITVPSTNSFLYKIGFTKEFDKNVGHLRRYTVKSLSDKLVFNNFKIIHVKKFEGLLRNLLFCSKYTGLIIKVLNKFSVLSDVVNFSDNLSLKIVGESQIAIIAKKL